MAEQDIDSFDGILEITQTAAIAAFKDLKDGFFDTYKNLIVPQLHKIAVAVWDVKDGLWEGDYTPEGAAELLDMARRAVVITIAGATELVRTDVRAAVNRIFKALEDAVKGATKLAISSIL